MKATMRRAAAEYQAALRDRRGNFRERFSLPNGESVLCESRSEYDWWSDFTGAVASKQVKPEEFSLLNLFESFIPDGQSIASAWKRGESVRLSEAATPITSALFSNITGQIVYSKMLDAFESEEFMFSKMIPTTPTQFTGERIPGVARLGDQAEIVSEGQPYPYALVSEDWIDTPETVKRGTIVPVTREAIAFDRTSLVLKRAGEVGESLGLNKEKRAIDCVIDENTTAHRYRWRGTTYATYVDTPWDNLAASNGLVDYSDIDAAEQLFANLVDPNTGEPIMVLANTMIVTPQLVATARRVLNAIQVAMHVGGYAVSGNLTSFVSPNPVGGGPFSSSYNLVSSRLMAARMATDTTWFLGDPRKAFTYMENFPLRTETSPPNSEDEFKRDIVTQYKAGERGAYATLEPRAMVKSTA